MRKALGLALAGLGAAALTGAALAASRDTHVLNVSLPDGSIAHVEYVGSVAPKVTVSPGPVAPAWSPFAILGPSAFDLGRQIDAMMQAVNGISRSNGAATPNLNVAGYASAPAGSSSVTIVTTSDGRRTCTRRTEVTSDGAGKAPKVVSSLSGDCGSAQSQASPERNPT